MPIKKIQCSNQDIFFVYALVCHLFFPHLLSAILPTLILLYYLGKILDEYLEQKTIEDFPSDFF